MCISLGHDSVEAIVADDELRGALQQYPDALIEVRAERFGPQAAHALQKLGAHVPFSRMVVACRHASELPRAQQHTGAARSVQTEVYAHAAQAGCAWLDIDARSLGAHKPLQQLAAGRSRHTQLLRSWHEYGRVPSLVAVRRFLADSATLGADASKLAVPARPLSAAAALWRFSFLQREASFLLVLMGESGAWARLCAARSASPPPLSYVRLRASDSTAPGQPDWQTYKQLTRPSALGLSGDVYGVVGMPLGHSLSPALHTRVLDVLGLPGCYVPFCVGEPHDLSTLLQQIAPVLGVRGLSVTLPAKRRVLRVRPKKSAAVRHGGACNTLWRTGVRPSGRWLAENTDVTALLKRFAALAPKGLRGRSVAILGAGGVARAAVVALRSLGARPVVMARRLRAARSLSADARPWPKAGSDGLEFAGVVQCTPVGMQPNSDALALDVAWLRTLPHSAFVLDTIYRPKETLLVQAARQIGLRAEGGLPMFLAQAAGQCVRFYGRTLSEERLAAELDAILAAGNNKIS